ncbi:MAG: VWA domain-containing protein [Planctomycetota bacterium]
MIPLSFAEPWWLAAALLAVPLGVIGLRSFGAMTKWRAWSAVLTRAVLMSLLAMMLAGASAVRTSDRMTVIAVVDVSESVERFASAYAKLQIDGSPEDVQLTWKQAVQQWLASATADRGAEDYVGVVVFDGGQLAVATPTRAELDNLALDFKVSTGSDIAAALRYAGAMFPPGGRRRIVLATDGNETSGDMLEAAQELASNGIKVDILTASYRVQGEVMIEAVDVPPHAPQEATIPLRVAIRATDVTSGTLEVLYEGRALDLAPNDPATGIRRTLQPGLNVIDIPVDLSDRSTHRFEPIFTPDDASGDRIATNNRAEAITVTPDKGTTLIVDGVTEGSVTPLAETLIRAGIETEVIAPTELPNDLLSLQGYGLIVLENVPAEEIPRQTHDLLVEYVRTLGGGLVMVGGPDSFGAGGWNGTALEDALPVELDLPEEMIIPQAAIAIVIDKSGSMAAPVQGGARSQQRIANDAAALAIETMDESDLLTVIAFDDGMERVVEFGPNTDVLGNANKVRRIGMGGGTSMYPALERAGRDLTNAEAEVKHIIVLTDGQSAGDPRYGFQIASRLSDNGITVSTIAVGDGADDATLRRIASIGGGEFYDVIDPNQLPTIFLKDIRIVRKPMIRETEFTPAWTGTPSPLLGDIQTLGAPPLQGYVLTQHRADPKITTPLVGPEGEPILAHWFYGRGRVAAFTSDASVWARNWLNWPGYDSMWLAIARSTSRPAADTNMELITEVREGEFRVRLDAADNDGQPLDLLSVPATVILPSGDRANIRLEQDGPGTYSASIPSSEQGSYVVILQPSLGPEPLAPVVGGASRAIGPELRRLESNTPLLQQVADAAGGELLAFDNAQGADLFNRTGLLPQRSIEPIWQTLLIWTLVMLLLDVATRRIAWDRWLTRDLAEEFRMHAARTVREHQAAAAGAVEQLRKGKEGRKDKRKAKPTSKPKRPIKAPSPSPVAQPSGETKPKMPSKPQAPPSDQKPDQKEKAEEGGTSSLLAAKRRAQRRYGSNHDRSE